MSKRVRFVAAGLLSIAALAQPCAWAQDVRDLSAQIAPFRARYKLQGMAAMVVSSEGVLAKGADGVRKKGDATPITADDKFHMGSCTKAMTATVIAMLVEEGLLSWDASVGEFFADKVEGAHANWKRVTLAQLLYHRGGAPNHLEIDGLWWRLKNHEGTPVEARLDLARGVLPKPPRFEPGKDFLYSNAGFAIAGAMAEIAAEKAWEELMVERLFAPLGMASAGFGAPGVAGSVEEPWGHKPDGYAVEPGPTADNPPAIGPAGTAHATLADWGKFVGLHLAGGRGEAKLISDESFKKLQTAWPGGEYAMGWFDVPRGWSGGRALNHAGSNTQWYCIVWAAPQRDFAVLVATNQGGGGAEKACKELSDKLLYDHLNWVKQQEEK
jgi:CubicO group peptidase (beta-lactamase class C family)